VAQRLKAVRYRHSKIDLCLIKTGIESLAQFLFFIFAPMNKYFSLVLIAAWFLPVIVFAQTGRSFQISAGFSSAAVRDLGFSPLVYTGSETSGALMFSIDKEKRCEWVVGQFFLGNLHNRVGTGMRVMGGSVQNFIFYRAGRPVDRGMHWGWSGNNFFSTRNNSSVLNFNSRTEFFTSFGPAARYQYPFRLLKRTFRLDVAGHVQVIGFRVGSSFVSSVPAGFYSDSGFAGFWNSLEWFHPGNSWNFGCWPRLHFELKTGSQLSLGYRYDFMRIEGAHRSARSAGFWFLTLTTPI
jgi:hypothetical protein